MLYSINEDDKKYINKWVPKSDAFNITNIKINNIDIKYIEAIAVVESPGIPINSWIVDGKPLPKEIRVNKNISTILFLERLGSTYCIMIGSKQSEGRIRSHLMKTSNKRNGPEWGRVEFKEVPGYIFDKHFYYWLIKSKKNLINTVDNRSFVLNDVKGFKSDSERQSNSYEGEGSNIDSEVPLKSLVSLDEKLVSLYIDILIDHNKTYNFFLDYDGRISIYPGSCGKFVSSTPEMFEINQTVLNIYFDILPMLLSEFNKAKQNGWNELENSFKKELSIDVIVKLIQENNINIREIQQAIMN